MRLTLNTIVFKQFLLETLQLFILLAFASCPICVCRHFDDKDLRQIPITATAATTTTNTTTLTSALCTTIATVEEISAAQAKTSSLSSSLATLAASTTVIMPIIITTTTTTGIPMKYEGVHVTTVTRPDYVYPTLNSGIEAINSTPMASSFDSNSQNNNNNNNNNNNYNINSNYRKDSIDGVNYLMKHHQNRQVKIPNSKKLKSSPITQAILYDVMVNETRSGKFSKNNQTNPNQHYQRQKKTKIVNPENVNKIRAHDKKNNYNISTIMTKNLHISTAVAKKVLPTAIGISAEAVSATSIPRAEMKNIFPNSSNLSIKSSRKTITRDVVDSSKNMLLNLKKTDALMLSYIFDTFSTADKHHHHDQRYGPHFEDILQVGQRTNLTVQAGSGIHLNCRISLLQDKTVSWVRRNSNSELDLLTVGLHTYTADKRFKMEFQYPNNWRLKINNLKKEDEAMYECQISTHPPRLIQINLFVNAPKVMIVDEFGDPLQEKYYEIDSTLQLLCVVRNVAMSMAVVLWKHGDNILNYDVTRGGVSVKTELMDDGANSSLHIAKIKKADSGNYTCSISDTQNFSMLVHILNGESFAELHHGASVTAFRPTVACISLIMLILLRCSSICVSKNLEFIHYTYLPTEATFAYMHR